MVQPVETITELNFPSSTGGNIFAVRVKYEPTGNKFLIGRSNNGSVANPITVCEKGLEDLIDICVYLHQHYVKKKA